MDNLKQLQGKVKEAAELLEGRILNRKGKRNAQSEAEIIFNELDLIYSKGRRESYTIYYLSLDSRKESISLFIEYNTSGKVTGIKIY